MNDRTVALMAALLELHEIPDLKQLLQRLVTNLSPHFGPTVACCYLFEGAGKGLYLAGLAGAEDYVSLDQWRMVLEAPTTIGLDEGQAAIRRLAAAERASLTGSLATVVDGLWNRATAERVQDLLGVRFATAAAIRTADGPIGLVLLMVQGRLPAGQAAQCAAHLASAVARLCEQPDAQAMDNTPLNREAMAHIALREISRAHRYGRKLSLVVVERIDPVSDDAEGDGRSWELASVAIRIARQPDVIGYLNQRRVVCLLPETGIEGALGYLRRLQTVSAESVGLLSGGCAAFPADGTTFSQLVDVAVNRLGVITGAGERDEDTATTRWSGGPEDITDAYHSGPAKATVRVRVAPLSDESEMAEWQGFLERLETARAVEACGYDGFAGMYDVRTPSVAKLLGELQRAGSRIGAEITPTVTGEVGFTLRSRSAAAGAARDPSAQRFDADQAHALAARQAERMRSVLAKQEANRNRPQRLAMLGISIAAVLATLVLAAGRHSTTDGASTAISALAEVPHAEVRRDLSGTCRPESGRGTCDTLRAALWSGDIVAWLAWGGLRTDSGAATLQDQAAKLALEMRIAAGDPAARGEDARRAGRPWPVISAIRYRGIDGLRRIVGVEITNVGGSPADLGGLLLPGALGEVPPGATLAPGRGCVAGPAAAPEEACPFALLHPDLPLSTRGERVRLATVGGELMDEFTLP